MNRLAKVMMLISARLDESTHVKECHIFDGTVTCWRNKRDWCGEGIPIISQLQLKRLEREGIICRTCAEWSAIILEPIREPYEESVTRANKLTLVNGMLPLTERAAQPYLSILHTTIYPSRSYYI